MPNFNTIVFAIKLKEAHEKGDNKEYKKLCDMLAYICLERDDMERYLKKKSKK
jgi:hypothetical protein|tara:strand:- start:544 stop:702 length:159 start_codon:yes stop_codon:yes gene_type:complete